MAMAESTSVKVLGLWASPFVIRARIALNLKSIKYEYIEENISESKTKSELLLKSNPVYKKVPVLLHAGNPVCESLIIIQYIDEVWKTSGPSILPPNPYDRARSRFWAAYIDDKWLPPFEEALFPETEEAKKAAIAQMEEGLLLLEEAFGKLSEGKAFFGGDEIGYMDIVLGSPLVWLQVLEKFSEVKLLNQTSTPCLLQWADRFTSHEAVKGVMPEFDKLMDYGAIIRARVLKAKANAK